MTETRNPESALVSSSDGSSPQLAADLTLQVPAIFLFNRRGDRLHCFTTREAAISYLRAAMLR